MSYNGREQCLFAMEQKKDCLGIDNEVSEMHGHRIYFVTE